jgi:hypothetical protein
VNFEEWKREVPERIKAEPEWGFYAYPKALFLYDLVWHDCEKLVRDRPCLCRTGDSQWWFCQRQH